MPLPPLPLLPAEWRTIICTEQLPPQHQATNTLPGINRLTLIGDAVLQLCIAEWLHEQSSTESAAELIYQKGEISSEMPQQWEKRYELANQELAQTSNGTNPRGSTSQGDIFRAYVAAVYFSDGGARGGLERLSTWIKAMLDFDEKEEDSHDEDSSSDESGGKTADELSGMLSSLLVPRFDTPKPKEGSTPSTSGLNLESPSSRNSLSILNEKATRKRIQLSWNDVDSGPGHAKNWSSTLFVEGKEYTGTGSSKKGSRYIAAENALKDLKWV